jgi:P27 family predicted phage terminase small subunit
MGRPRKNPEIRKLEGNRSKTPIPEPVKVATGEVAVPDHLDEDAQACLELIKRSLPPKTYAMCDIGLLSAYAVAWSEHKKAVIALRDEPRMVEGSTGQLVINPWIKHLNESARLMLSIGPRLFLDPVARASLKVPDEKPASKFDGLIETGSALKRSYAS